MFGKKQTQLQTIQILFQKDNKLYFYSLNSNWQYITKAFGKLQQLRKKSWINVAMTMKVVFGSLLKWGLVKKGLVSGEYFTVARQAKAVTADLWLATISKALEIS